jgi:hypothetical protein
MALTPYCTNDEVRSLLGVSLTELKDAVLDLPVYATGLRRELIRVSTLLPSAFSTVAAITGARTDAQQTLYETTMLFAAYAAARQSGASLGQFSPKEMTDDKASFGRFSSDPYKDTLDRVDAGYALAREDLVQAYAAYAGSSAAVRTTPATFLIASTRAYDPITGV